MPPQSVLLSAVFSQRSLTQVHWLVLPSHKQSHYSSPSDELNPANWAGRGVRVCCRHTPTAPVPPLRQFRVNRASITSQPE